MFVNRRLFLQGLGGACVAAPFLGSVAERAAKAQDMPAPTAPQRLIIMFTHYGCLTNRWFPGKSHGPLTAADYQGLSIEPLAPYASKLLVPRGIRAMNEWTADASLGQGNSPHTQVVGTYFTCVPVTPHQADPFALDNTAGFNAMPTAPSLDHVCAQQLSPGGIPLMLRVGGSKDSAFSAVSYSAGETLFHGFGSVADVLSELTGLLQGGSEVSPDAYRALRGKSVIDLVKGDLETLERVEMSSADKRKLAAWKELLHQATPVLRTGCSEDMLQTLGLTGRPLGAPTGIDQSITDKVEGSDLDYADLCSNVAALSALCDYNRVILLKYPANYVFKGLGITSETDNLNHRIDGPGMGGTCVAHVNEALLTIDRYYAEKFAHLVGQLDAIEEGDVKLLDNSATVWFHETSDGNAFNLNNMPILQAGGCGGYFKTGGAVNVDDGSADLPRGNSEEPCIDPGYIEPTNIKITGTPREFANAPINKYYCTLMNAIGVKAGADGFPAVGGTELVTHYGMYDRTEDFASGGELPPNINDPGEFDALRG